MFLFKWFPWNFSSKNEKPTIMDMPHLVMTQILDNVGFLGIQNLRKTCKSFRNFIDDFMPINDLKAIRIQVSHYHIRVTLVVEKNRIRESFAVYYQIRPDDYGCFVNKNHPEFAEKIDEHFMDALFQDLEPILKNQRSKLTDLEIKVNSFIYKDIYDLVPQSKFQSIFYPCLCSRFKKFKRVLSMTADERNRQHMKTASEIMNRFEKILKSRKVPLKVENLGLTVFESSQIFQILPFIITNSLEGRQAYQGWFYEKKDAQTLSAIPKCESFKNMKSLKILSFLLMNPISDFLVIPELSIKRESISRDDIVFLKQAFLTNSHLKKWEVNFMKSEGYSVIQEVLGRNQYDLERQWYFKIPNSAKILFIYINYIFDSIYFTRINTDDVPKYALIQ